MNLENYKILKFANNEMIICEISGETVDNYEVSNPLKMDVIPKLSSDGQVNEILNLKPWLQHFSEQRYFEVNKSHCILIADASTGLARYYEHVIRKIDANWGDEDILSPDVTNYIGECFLKIATHLSYRPNFINYTYRDEMISDGIENCLQYVKNFNPEKSKNPFAYFAI